jgi:hypothetical protein
MYCSSIDMIYVSNFYCSISPVIAANIGTIGTGGGIADSADISGLYR